MRLSIINFAGTARTDVAVGTVKDASMLCTTRAETPRNGSTVAAPGETNVGIGLTTGSAGFAVDNAISVAVGADCEVGITAAATAGVTGGVFCEVGCVTCWATCWATGCVTCWATC
ncbi:unannotated protein [freshwater metagenome]|uniref:Unannotated protein n=1 Tax=freshwater metagenome TaxID=449393 RepID=A0A6J6LF15_9ZZZZ